MQEFEIYLKEIGGFKEAIWEREKKKEIEREKRREGGQVGHATKFYDSNWLFTNPLGCYKVPLASLLSMQDLTWTYNCPTSLAPSRRLTG